MIKKSVFENDLITGMIHELHAHDQKQGMNNLVKAADYLHSAMDILEEAGLTVKADKLLNILNKIAQDAQATKAHKDHSTHGLTSDKMVENLKHHGHTLNDSSKADDLLNLDINDTMEISVDEDKTFEDSD